MKSVAVLCALLGLTTLVNGQSLLTIFVANSTTAPAPTGTAGGNEDFLVEVGEADGVTTYVENQVKSVYTSRASGALTTFTTTPTTASATLIVSASGFKYIHSVVLPDDRAGLVGESECTIDGKGGAACVVKFGTDSNTFTTTQTGLAQPTVFTVSPSASATGGGDAGETTGTGGQQGGQSTDAPSKEPGAAMGQYAVNFVPLAFALSATLVGALLT